jgi:hypothetical protein
VWERPLRTALVTCCCCCCGGVGIVSIRHQIVQSINVCPFNLFSFSKSSVMSPMGCILKYKSFLPVGQIDYDANNNNQPKGVHMQLHL